MPLPGSFEHVAREWLTTVHDAKVSTGHAERTRIRLEQHVFPWLGRRPIAEIEAPELLQTLRRIESRRVTRFAARFDQASGRRFLKPDQCLLRGAQAGPDAVPLWVGSGDPRVDTRLPRRALQGPAGTAALTSARRKLERLPDRARLHADSPVDHVARDCPYASSRRPAGGRYRPWNDAAAGRDRESQEERATVGARVSLRAYRVATRVAA